MTTTLRPLRNDADRAFIFAAYEEALKAHVGWAWGWNAQFQREGFWTHHPFDEFRMVEVDGQRAGGLHVRAEQTIHHVRLVFLLPQFRGLGIGTRLLLEEARRARLAGKALGLRVIRSNPAKGLYERLGFRVVGKSDVTFDMQLD